MIFFCAWVAPRARSLLCLPPGVQSHPPPPRRFARHPLHSASGVNGFLRRRGAATVGGEAWVRARASSATWTAQFASSPSFDDGAQRQNLVHGSPVYSFSLLRELPQRGPLYCTGAAPRRAPPPCCLRQPNPPRWPAAAAVLLDTASLPFAGRGGGQRKKRRQPPPRALCTARPAGSRVRAAGRRPLSSRAAIWFPLPSPATPAPSPPTAASIPTAPRRREPGALQGDWGFPLPSRSNAPHAWRATVGRGRRPTPPQPHSTPFRASPPPPPPTRRAPSLSLSTCLPATRSGCPAPTAQILCLFPCRARDAWAPAVPGWHARVGGGWGRGGRRAGDPPFSPHPAPRAGVAAPPRHEAGGRGVEGRDLGGAGGCHPRPRLGPPRPAWAERARTVPAVCNATVRPRRRPRRGAPSVVAVGGREHTRGHGVGADTLSSPAPSPPLHRPSLRGQEGPPLALPHPLHPLRTC